MGFFWLLAICTYPPFSSGQKEMNAEGSFHMWCVAPLSTIQLEEWFSLWDKNVVGQHVWSI